MDEKRDGENRRDIVTPEVIGIIRDTLPQAWEDSLRLTWEYGRGARTEYDQEARGDPPSRDVTLFLVVENPLKEPRLHRAFPGGLEELEIYRQEVLHGVHDHWIKPSEGKWSYTYHGGMFNRPVLKIIGPDGKEKNLEVDDYNSETDRVLVERINQFDYIIDKLTEAPHTRRAQAITWRVEEDTRVNDPACLQRMWFRIFGNELQMNLDIRSNDAYKAAFMNMWAFTDIQRYVAEQVSERLGRKIRPGRYIHKADSFHIYGSYFSEFKGFLDSLQKRNFEERIWDSTSKEVQSAFRSARNYLLQEPILPEEHRKRLKAELAGN